MMLKPKGLCLHLLEREGHSPNGCLIGLITVKLEFHFTVSSSTPFSLTNISNRSDLTVCCAMGAESLSSLENNNYGKTSEGAQT